MHKITKGLKKKKKGKKSKHKEEELFKPEELEAYRREHQGTSEEPSVKNEEWKKFNALTSGVDDILKKTQGDLDRIKSTSFFKRIPPASEVKKQEEEQHQQKVAEQAEKDKVLHEEEQIDANIGIVLISESESEEEDDDIFDTAYIDAIAKGEVKLAYIPESPTDVPEGDDPFDTSIAERAILGPAVQRKGKKLVPIGAAVEVLTGRVQLPTCATQRPVHSRRQILKERDLLLGSFDDNANSILPGYSGSPEEVKRTLLDDDSIPLPDEPIDLSKTLHQIPTKPYVNTENNTKNNTKDILEQFDVINKLEDDEDDKEFEALAAESVNKTNIVTKIPLVATVVANKDIGWNAFGEDQSKVSETDNEEIEIDPFDTTFANNILPGKAELKIIENEILNEDIDFDPRAEESVKSKVSINITYPCGQKESVSFLDRISEQELNCIKPIHRDLLGGSNTDLSQLNDHPLKPSEKVDENYIEYCDPFDTSIVEIAKQPGQIELKFLEKELLGDIKNKLSLSDEDFDPRAEEEKPRERTISRPDVLNISGLKTVSFDLPSAEKDLLGAGDEHKIIKPLTPFYVRKNSVPESNFKEEVIDPFDTSFVSDIAPGKAELKLIETELFDPNLERRLSISDQDFDPRDEKKLQFSKAIESIKEISNPKFIKTFSQPEPIDLLNAENNISSKVLTPAAEQSYNIENIIYKDPFDTSIACNIQPGKTELKLLETELIHSGSVKDDFDDTDFNPRLDEKKVDLLINSSDILTDKPLSPSTKQSVSFQLAEEIVDPFDTSFANNIQPGKAELKFLESELI